MVLDPRSGMLIVWFQSFKYLILLVPHFWHLISSFIQQEIYFFISLQSFSAYSYFTYSRQIEVSSLYYCRFICLFCRKSAYIKPIKFRQALCGSYCYTRLMFHPLSFSKTCRSLAFQYTQFDSFVISSNAALPFMA